MELLLIRLLKIGWLDVRVAIFVLGLAIIGSKEMTLVSENIHALCCGNVLSSHGVLSLV